MREILKELINGNIVFVKKFEQASKYWKDLFLKKGHNNIQEKDISGAEYILEKIFKERSIARVCNFPIAIATLDSMENIEDSDKEKAIAKLAKTFKKSRSIGLEGNRSIIDNIANIYTLNITE